VKVLIPSVRIAAEGIPSINSDSRESLVSGGMVTESVPSMSRKPTLPVDGAIAQDSCGDVIKRNTPVFVTVTFIIHDARDNSIFIQPNCTGGDRAKRAAACRDLGTGNDPNASRRKTKSNRFI
jgi:hypothetical protein